MGALPGYLPHETDIRSILFEATNILTAQGPVQYGLEYLQGQGILSFSGQPVPVSTSSACPHREGV